MTVKEYIGFGVRGIDEFGVKGYFLQKTNALDKPKAAKIWGGVKKTYVDEAVKAKSFVPPA